jgi:3-isopropylmalate dehydrogenase
VTAALITLLPGDGIGPEVVAVARAILELIASRGGHDLEFVEQDIGGAAIDRHGTPLPDETLESCRISDAILLGAVGGPQWSHLTGDIRPEQGLLAIRKALGLFANLRPIPIFPALAHSSPLQPSRLVDVDLLFVRELTGGIYFGPRQEDDGSGSATDTMLYTREEVERVAHVAFRAAQGRRKRVTSVDKANVLASSRLWRRTVDRVSEQYPDVELQHLLVDACAMHLIQKPADFDVILTGNLFGDILSDEASVLAASLGMLPSASLGDGRQGLYEPVHGSAPDIAGTGNANPIAALLSAALLLRYSFDMEAEAAIIEDAVDELLAAGMRTADIQQGDEPTCSTREFGLAVAKIITRQG